MTREEAIEEFRHSIAMSKLDLKVNKKNMSIEREIMVLNSIARNDMAIKALEQEPISETDIILTREEYGALVSSEYNNGYAKGYREALEQEPKTGHWIEKDGFDGDTYYDCSVCGESWTTIEGNPWDNGMRYCPNCGAKMESEGKK